MKSRYALLVLVSLPLAAQQPTVRLGSEVFLENHIDSVQHQRVGIICNHTSLLSNKTHFVDTLLARNIAVKALFAPEHGFRGAKPRGELVSDTVDGKSGLPIYSLYGAFKKPPEEVLRNIDVLVYDIQDVGARYYSYPWSMMLAMEAAASAHKTFIVLDRPNPINGMDIEGPTLDTTLRSSAGAFPIPTRYGLTIGEVAKMIVGERWIEHADSLKLVVIPMEGWRRDMWYDATKLPWTPPSPNIKTLAAATVYPGTCVFEGTNVSEGRGTFKPFEYIGAPWIDRSVLARKLNERNLPGVKFHPIVFIPRSDSLTEVNPKYRNQLCEGIYIQVTDRNRFRPVSVALQILFVIRSTYSSNFKFIAQTFDALIGSKEVREKVADEDFIDTLRRSWTADSAKFQLFRQEYLLY